MATTSTTQSASNGRSTANIPLPPEAPDGLAERATSKNFSADDLEWLNSPTGTRWLTDVDYHLLTGDMPPKIIPFAAPDTSWEEPEDRSAATLSPQGEIEYVEDIGRPGRIMTVAAEEGTGKSYAFQGELAIRLATAGGTYWETYEINQTGPVLYLSEMNTDDDYAREEQIMASLGVTRKDLEGRLFRQNLNTAAGGQTVLDSAAWYHNFDEWAKEHQPIALIVDPATSATDSEPWGKELRQLFRKLRQLQIDHPTLLIILVVHMKKPSGRGHANATRGLDSVMGEYGRMNDVTIIMQNDGSDLDKVVVSVRKRVKTQRRIRLTKRDGLLVDPQPIDGAPEPKVSLAHVHEVIRENPGMTIRALKDALGVAATTASGYVQQLEGKVTTKKGPRNATLLYDILYIPGETQEDAA